jgi:hypothetical protein
MNSGRDFEQLVLSSLQQCLESHKLGLVPGSCRLRRNRAYYSKQRDADIITDIAIEIYMEGATEPHIIWVWECKDHADPLPVRYVEEFHAKLQQIGADRTKGTMVTRNGFQAGALAFAKSNGIGLARYLVDLVTISPLGGPPWKQMKKRLFTSRGMVTLLTTPVSEMNTLLAFFPLGRCVAMMFNRTFTLSVDPAHLLSRQLESWGTAVRPPSRRKPWHVLGIFED